MRRDACAIRFAFHEWSRSGVATRTGRVEAIIDGASDRFAGRAMSMKNEAQTQATMAPNSRLGRDVDDEGGLVAEEATGP